MQKSRESKARKQPKAQGKKEGKSKAKRQRGRQGTGTLGLGMSGGTRLMRNSRVVEEDEFIADVNGSTQFTTTAYPYNPGQVLTFPRFSKEAVLYEKYMTESIVFYYKRTVSEFSTDGQTGKVILSFDYDAADAPPTTKQMVEDMMPHSDGMPCTPEIRLPLDRKELNGQDSKYVRPAGLPGSTDIRVYDGGNLYVSTVGTPNTNPIGELRVRYRIRLMVPILQSGAPPANNQVALLESQSTTIHTDTVLPLGSVIANGIGLTNAAGQILLPAGNYLVDAYGYQHTPGADMVGAELELRDYQNTPLAIAIFVPGAAATVSYAPLSLTWYLQSDGVHAYHFVATETSTAHVSDFTLIARFTAI